MAKIRLTSDQWGDFVATFLLDAVVHDDVLVDNEDFRILMDNMKAKMKTQLLKYYLEMDTSMRSNYRRVRKDLVGETEAETIIDIKNPTKFKAV